MGKLGREKNVQIHINYWPNGSNHSRFVTDMSRVQSVDFHENPFNEHRETAQKEHSSSSKVPLVIDRREPKLHNL